MPNLWGHLKDGVLEVCKEVCGKKSHQRSKEMHSGEMKR